MAGKEWTPGVGGPEEWSVHAQLSFTPQTGNVVLTASEGPSRDSGYSSERLVNPRGLLGARATCCVTVGGHHTVTLTCTEIPEAPGPPGGAAIPPQTVHFCHHPPPEKPHRHYHPPPSPPNVPQPSPPEPTRPSSGTPLRETILIPVLKDAASQTSTTNVPQAVKEPPKKRKSRPNQTSAYHHAGSSGANKSSTSGSDSKKNPRTVHIDVYCTGSESDSSSSSNEDTNTNSTPQTVFESNQVKVMHSRAHSDSLPHALQRQKRRVLSNSRLDVLPKDESGSTISTSYPSPRSSLVSNTTGGFSLTSDSMLSSKFSSNNNSSAATSWKDTDLDSTQTSLFKSDSFDYENSFDKLRIRQKERIWSVNQPERPKRFHKRPASNNNHSSDSSDDDDEEEGLAWSFGRYEDIDKRRSVKREDTVRHQSSETAAIGRQIPLPLRKSGSLSDSEASNIKKFKHENAAVSSYPSTSYPFQHWAKATKFGSLISCLKRPGHHVGPSKNPDCSCDTCKYFFEHVCYRNRTRSLSETPFM